MERSGPARDRRSGVALERTLLRVRWFGIALGIYLVASYVPIPGGTLPPSTNAIAGAGLALLFVTNVTVTLVLRGDPTPRALERLGLAAFLADIASVWTIVWAYNFEQFGATWVIVTVLLLEGALRRQLVGALTPFAIAVPIETIREVVRYNTFPGFSEVGVSGAAGSLVFRLGIYFMIGFVAGAMSRNLERARADAEARALDLEGLARREAEARRESAAFQQVILAGVSAAGDLGSALQSMTDTISSELGYDRTAVLMRNDDGSLSVIALTGFPGVEPGARVEPGVGIAGFVARTGRPEIIPDVRVDPRYLPVHPATRSQVTLPISTPDGLLGVLDVESDEFNAFDAADVARLERLCAQMALVVQNARLIEIERRTIERLRELDTMKSDFIAIASHELRTPLTALQGSIKTLRRAYASFSPEEASELLGILDRQSDRLTRLVEDLLVVSRIDAGHVQLRLDSVDLGALLGQIVEELGARATRISLAVAPDLPRILTDGDRVAQILRNIIENALKFAPDDTAVRVGAQRGTRHVVIQVADEGPGIPGDELLHIFERFHQVGGSMRRRSDGFGLGLYIAQRLSQALGAHIEARSEVGQGATFELHIPIVTADEAADTA